MNILDNSLLVWILIAGVGFIVLRFVFKVTKKILTLAIMIGVAVALYIYITQNLLPGLSLP